MSEASNEVAIVATAPKARNSYFKWTDDMEGMLVKAVMANKAYKKSKSVNETYEVKYNRVIIDLWSRKVFSDQGPKQAWTTVQVWSDELYSESYGQNEKGEKYFCDRWWLIIT